MANGAPIRLTTGSLSFEGGVDSSKTPTIRGDDNPTGLATNQLAWLINGTVRGGGITQRTGWTKLAESTLTAWYQGGYIYEPDSGYPYLVMSIAGRIFRVRVDTDNSVEEITIPGDPNPTTPEKVWMCQAEQFLIIQDGVSVPLIWDGTTLQRVSSMPDPAGPVLDKIPTGTAMDYYMGRLWIANGREYTAGDIVRGPSGTAGYGLRDSVLKMTEVAYLTGGGAFIVPTNAGNIRAIAHSANLDTALGQGQLFIFTRKAIYSLDVPVDRTQWSTVDEDNQPLQKVVQLRYGTTGERSIVSVNGDLFYQSPDGVRSLAVAVRYFQQWGNIPISANEERAIKLNDRSLLMYGSGIEFDNRLWQTCLPFNTDVGVAHQGVMVLDYDPLGNLQERLNPVWDGIYEGLDFMQLFTGDFGGRFRAFSVIHSKLTGGIEIWEMSDSARFENGDNRVTWVIETPSYHWNTPFGLKELDTIELWVDKLYGRVDFWIYYRPDQHPCWIFWHKWDECAARNECEDLDAPLSCDYPEQTYCEQYRAMMLMPKPTAECQFPNRRPTNLGYSFQFKIVIKGWCRLRGLMAYAFPREKSPYEGIRCVDVSTSL